MILFPYVLCVILVTFVHTRSAEVSIIIAFVMGGLYFFTFFKYIIQIHTHTQHAHTQHAHTC